MRSAGCLLIGSEVTNVIPGLLYVDNCILCADELLEIYVLQILAKEENEEEVWHINSHHGFAPRSLGGENFFHNGVDMLLINYAVCTARQ